MQEFSEPWKLCIPGINPNPSNKGGWGRSTFRKADQAKQNKAENTLHGNLFSFKVGTHKCRISFKVFTEDS